MSSANLSTLPETVTAMFAAASFAEYTSMAIMSSRSVGASPALYPASCAPSWYVMSWMVHVLSRSTPESSATMAVMILVIEAGAMCSVASWLASTLPSWSMIS